MDKKFFAAKGAFDEINSSSGKFNLGIGTGSTTTIFINEFLPNLKERINNIFSSSNESTELLEDLKFVVSQGSPSNFILDYYIDGADEIDKNYYLIKGGGGAHTKEKVLAAASKKFICIADDSKEVETLGKFPLPIEVIPFAEHSVRRSLETVSKKITKRSFLSDSGNIILDMHNMHISEPEKMERELISYPGIVEVGIFAKNKPTSIKIGRDSCYESIDC
jgi:ribose 5-phosphate isomerase A